MRLEFLMKKLVATLSLKIHFSIECRKIKYPFIFYVLYIRADFLSFGINFNRGALYHGESETGLSDRDKRDVSVEEDSASQTSAACIIRYSTELDDWTLRSRNFLPEIFRSDEKETPEFGDVERKISKRESYRTENNDDDKFLHDATLFLNVLRASGSEKICTAAGHS